MAARESWHWVARAIGALAVALTGGVRAAPATVIRVAVTDFQPGSATPEDDRALGAGLQSMLTTDLAASSRIAVVERARLADLRKEMKLAHSAAADPATAVKLGRLAGATHLVTGSFTLVGKQMRLDARVIDVATGWVALATNATGERDAFFELEKKIAGAVVEQLGVTLTPKERASFGRVHTADLQALRRFSEGLRLFDDADYDRSLAALRDATARDADFKLASTTLEEYERIAREIRSRAAVLDAKRDLDSALQRRDLRAQEQGIVNRLMTVAGGKEGGSGARARRAAALYLAIRVLEGDAEGVDRFARERLLDGFVARYVHEADGLFPDVPMEPFEPMGEQYGEMNPPATPGEVDAAVSAAVDRFAHYGLKDPEEVRRYKQGHIQALFGKEISRVARAMHLDARRTAELTDHFYQGLFDLVLFTGGLPAWLFQSSSRPLSVGPRALPDVTADVRYGASSGDERSWALLILEGLPHVGAVLSLDLSFDPPADGSRCTTGRNCSAMGKKPRVVALFDATDVLVRATRHGRNLLDDVPMRATAVSLAGDSAERVDAEVLLASERMGTEGPKLSAGVNQPFPLPATTKVTVRREARQLVVEAGGRRASFDTSPARPGFVGLLFQGAGFARVSGLRVQAVH